MLRHSRPVAVPLLLCGLLLGGAPAATAAPSTPQRAAPAAASVHLTAAKRAPSTPLARTASRTTTQAVSFKTKRKRRTSHRGGSHGWIWVVVILLVALAVGLVLRRRRG